MTLWDTFLFAGELDLLECRFTELQDVPGLRHVIIEGAITFQGQPRKLAYPQHQERFAAWADRITYIPLTAADLPGGPDPFTRERTSREAARRALHGADPADVILVADCDEIPSPGALEAARTIPGPRTFATRNFFLAADWELTEPWPTIKAAPLGDIITFAAIREGLHPYLTFAGCQGWHFSWLGGTGAILAKARSFSHPELLPAIREAVDRGDPARGIFWGYGAGQAALKAVEVDETWPRWIRERKCPENWFRSHKP